MLDWWWTLSQSDPQVIQERIRKFQFAGDDVDREDTSRSNFSLRAKIRVLLFFLGTNFTSLRMIERRIEMSQRFLWMKPRLRRSSINGGAETRHVKNTARKRAESLSHFVA